MDELKKIYKGIKKVYDVIPMLALMGMVICVMVQIFTRFVIQVAVPWTQEAACTFLLLLCASGIVVTSRRGDHLGAFFLRDKAKGRAKTLLYLMSSVVCSVYLIIIAYGCFSMYSSQLSTMTATTMPWYQVRWNYLILSLGCFLTSLYCIRDFVWCIQMLIRGEEIQEDGRSAPKKED